MTKVREDTNQGEEKVFLVLTKVREDTNQGADKPTSIWRHQPEHSSQRRVEDRALAN